MDDALSLLRKSMQNIAALEALVRGKTADSDPVRAWARAHFRDLVGTEQALTRGSKAAPANGDETPGVAAHAQLLKSLEAVTTADQQDSIGVALGALLSLTGGQRGFIALREADGSLSFPAARAFQTLDVQSPEAQVSRTILDVAMRGEKPVIVEDAQADARFGVQRSVQALALRAVLVVPLVAEKKAFGVLYLDHPGKASAFGEDARSAAESFARLIAPILARDLELTALRQKRDVRVSELRERFKLHAIIGHSPAMVQVMELIGKVAPRDTSVLVVGETGTGKDLVAQAIHANSPRAGDAFVAVNCGALPNDLVESELFGHERGAFTGAHAARVGRFEAADGGTVFLDEIGEMPLQAQVKLLRVLESGTFERVGASKPRKCNVRLIAATNKDLAAEVAAGRFRADLLFRLRVIEIKVPPLRERDGDVALLARHFVDRFCKSHGERPSPLEAPVLEALVGYRWPGNVRELRNVLERAVVLAGASALSLDVLPPEIAGHAVTQLGDNLKRAVRAFKKRFVQQALADAQDDHAAAAARLGVHPKYLYQLIRDLNDDGDE